MVRVKIILDLSYLGTRFNGWQAQAKSAAALAPPAELAPPSLPGPPLDHERFFTRSFILRCRLYNRGRCQKGDGCRSAHICSDCYRRGLRTFHALCEGLCPEDEDASLQETVDLALRRAWSSQNWRLKGPGGLVPSGRTDRGVHAHQMLAFFNCHLAGAADDELPDIAERLPGLLNAQLPWDVRCRNAWWTKDLGFNTRGEATKTYTYYLAQQVEGSPLAAELRQAAWVLEDERPLDQALMCAVGRVLVGRHDFLALSSVRVGEAASTVREIESLEITCPRHVNFGLMRFCCDSGRLHAAEECQECGSCGAKAPRTAAPLDAKPIQLLRSWVEYSRKNIAVRISVKGQGFLKHMVRRIVGLLVEVGLHQRPPLKTLAELGVEADDRRAHGRPPKAPAQGLWLEKVEVDEAPGCSEANPAGGAVG
eukprot:g6763.t1